MTAVPEKIDVLWFLPTHGESRYLGTSIGGRNVDLYYLKQVAQAADSLGYYGVLIPTGRSCEDSWVVASALAPLTEKLRIGSAEPATEPSGQAEGNDGQYRPFGETIAGDHRPKLNVSQS